MSRKIDALVAERVMGYKWYRHKALTHEVVLALPIAYFEDGTLWEHNSDKRPNDERDSGNAPHYSTDISAAWEVVEHVLRLRNSAIEAKGGMTDVCIRRNPYTCEWLVEFDWSSGQPAQSNHDNKCVAICLAALRAVGVPESEIAEALQ